MCKGTRVRRQKTFAYPKHPLAGCGVKCIVEGDEWETHFSSFFLFFPLSQVRFCRSAPHPSCCQLFLLVYKEKCSSRTFILCYRKYVFGDREDGWGVGETEGWRRLPLLYSHEEREKKKILSKDRPTDRPTPTAAGPEKYPKVLHVFTRSFYFFLSE